MQAARLEGYIYLVGFALCIPAANWLLGHAGTVCPPNSPCLIPVAPSIMAPSGVPMIGLALVLRDLVQRRLGARWAIGAILAGAALSAFLAPPALVVASGVAFLLSELVDFAVYTPLQRRRLVLRRLHDHRRRVRRRGCRRRPLRPAPVGVPLLNFPGCRNGAEVCLLVVLAAPTGLHAR